MSAILLGGRGVNVVGSPSLFQDRQVLALAAA